MPLSLARQVHAQDRRQRGKKIYSLHAPETQCIGKGKAHKPYEFGVKVSVATPLQRCKGGQFIARVKAMPGAPYDGHTLATVIPAIEASTGATLKRLLVDRGYNFRLLLKWRALLCVLVLTNRAGTNSSPTTRQSE